MSDPLDEERKRLNRERSRLWRAKNRDHVRAKSQEWKKANPEKVKAGSRRYHEENKDSINARVSAWQKENRDKCAARQARHRESHPEKRDERLAKLRAYFATPEGKVTRVNGERRRRARMMGADTVATAAQVSAILLSAVACDYCETPFTGAIPPTLDHIVPLSKGGAHAPHNLTAACSTCNSRKGTSTVAEFAMRCGMSVPLVGNY